MLWRFLNMLKKISLMVITVAICFFYVSTPESSRVNPSNSYSEFIDDRAFEYINNIYSDVDFSSNFKTGNQSAYADYKEQYMKLLNCRLPFKSGEVKYYIDEYIYGEYEPEKYTYYFFDMDDDGLPELCIENNMGYIYIMKYLPISDEFILWHETSSSWIELLGSRKLWFYSGTSPIKYAFFSLNENGDVDYSVYLYIDPLQAETKYLITLPEFSDCSKALNVPDDIKSQSIEKDSHQYYRVTQSQWDELTKDFFTEKYVAKENIKKIRFNYKELFDN